MSFDKLNQVFSQKELQAFEDLELSDFVGEVIESRDTVNLSECLVAAGRGVVPECFAESRANDIIELFWNPSEISGNSSDQESDDLSDHEENDIENEYVGQKSAALSHKLNNGECELCGWTKRLSLHHAVPKLMAKRLKRKGIKNPVRYIVLCSKCHSKAHRLYNHRTLATKYNTVPTLRAALEDFD